MISANHNYQTDLGYTYNYVRLSLSFVGELIAGVIHPSEEDIMPALWLDSSNPISEIFCVVPNGITVRKISITSKTNGLYLLDNPFRPGTADYTFLYSQLSSNFLIKTLVQVGEKIKPNKLALLLTK